MKHKEDISILIVTHNHKDYISNLLSCLDKFSYENVYVCDANSTDGTAEILQNSKYQKSIIFKKKLESFSKNNNDLIKTFKLKTKYFLLLNPDVFFDIDFLKILHQKMEYDEKIGIAVPLIYYPNGEIQPTWKNFPSVINVIKKRIGLLKTSDEVNTKDSNIEWALGACMLISNKLLKNNNELLDERYRLYCEDVDICFETHHKGFKVVAIKESYIYHHLNEKSTKNLFSKYNYWNIASIIKFALKWNINYYARK